MLTLWGYAMLVLSKCGKLERIYIMPMWGRKSGVQPNVVYTVEANNPDNDHIWGDGNMSASEMAALADWYAISGRTDLTVKDLAEHTNEARTFKWNSQARVEILKGVDEYRKKFKL
jgi:hypothetical protein